MTVVRTFLPGTVLRHQYNITAISCLHNQSLHDPTIAPPSTRNLIPPFLNMKFSAMITASHAYGGPYKLLLLQFRGGQFIGAILALSCYAWLISTLSSDHLPVAAGPKAIVGIGTFVSVYILAMMPATWFCFGPTWFDWANIAGDVLAVAGSIAVAVLTRGSTSNCSSGLFVNGEESQVSISVVQEACKLQKVVFATGICNS